jgi:hypothetical protein
MPSLPPHPGRPAPRRRSERNRYPVSHGLTLPWGRNSAEPTDEADRGRHPGLPGFDALVVDNDGDPMNTFLHDAAMAVVIGATAFSEGVVQPARRRRLREAPTDSVCNPRCVRSVGRSRRAGRLSKVSMCPHHVGK